MISALLKKAVHTVQRFRKHLNIINTSVVFFRDNIKAWMPGNTSITSRL